MFVCRARLETVQRNRRQAIAAAVASAVAKLLPHWVIGVSRETLALRGEVVGLRVGGLEVVAYVVNDDFLSELYVMREIGLRGALAHKIAREFVNHALRKLRRPRGRLGLGDVPVCDVPVCSLHGERVTTAQASAWICDDHASLWTDQERALQVPMVRRQELSNEQDGETRETENVLGWPAE